MPLCIVKKNIRNFSLNGFQRSWMVGKILSSFDYYYLSDLRVEFLKRMVSSIIECTFNLNPIKKLVISVLCSGSIVVLTSSIMLSILARVIFSAKDVFLVML